MQNSNMLLQFLPLVLMFVIFYFLLIRPQKKKEKEIKDMRENLKVGDKVMTIGGIIGKIVLIKEDYVVIESSSNNSRLDLMKWGISGTFKDKTDLKEED